MAKLGLWSKALIMGKIHGAKILLASYGAVRPEEIYAVKVM